MAHAVAAQSAVSARLSLASRPVAAAASEGDASRVSVLRSKAPAPALNASSSSAPLAVASRSVSLRASSVAEATSSSAQETGTVYHYIVANAKFMLDEEEHFQEQLKERLRWLHEQGRPQDFWLLYEPKFLESFPEVAKRLSRPAVALVSTDGPWMTFMKLRLDRVLAGEYEADSQADALAAKPIDIQFDDKSWNAPYPKYEPTWWKPYVPQ